MRSPWPRQVGERLGPAAPSPVLEGWASLDPTQFMFSRQTFDKPLFILIHDASGPCSFCLRPPLLFACLFEA